jgi:hypothetical protein
MHREFPPFQSGRFVFLGAMPNDRAMPALSLHIARTFWVVNKIFRHVESSGINIPRLWSGDYLAVRFARPCLRHSGRAVRAFPADLFNVAESYR